MTSLENLLKEGENFRQICKNNSLITLKQAKIEIINVLIFFFIIVLIVEFEFTFFYLFLFFGIFCKLSENKSVLSTRQPV